MAAFTREHLREDPIGIARQDPTVVAAEGVLQHEQEDLNEADLQAGSACNGLQEAANDAEQSDPSAANTLNVLYVAKRQACEQSRAVAAERRAERDAEQRIVDGARAGALGGVTEAKARTEAEMALEANQ